jgi:glycosyltransferase involved in cell wall biosynthesis
MTFVHRQLSALRRFQPIGLCRFRWHEERFPVPRGGLDEYWRAGRALERVTRLGRPVELGTLTPLEHRFYERVLRHRRPALVHAHFADYALAVQPACEATGTPLVVTFHGYDASKRLREPAFERRYQRLLSRASLVIAVSKAMRDRLLAFGSPPERTAAHHIGVNLGPCPDDGQRQSGLVVQVARLVPKKGHLDTIEAFARARAVRSDLRLVIAGDGPLRAQLEREVERRRLSSCVRFTGDLRYADVERLLNQASVFLHPSVTTADHDEEGIPTTIAEAMAAAVPVIATRHAGIPELVEPGSGLLVEEGDAAGMGNALVDLTSDPAAARMMGADGRRSVERRFDLQRNTASLEEAYTFVARRRPTDAARLLNERL